MNSTKLFPLTLVLTPLVFTFGAGVGSALLQDEAPGTPTELNSTGFAFEREVTVPCTPEVAFDAFTGDITPWWDHSFSEKPHAMYIEPKPGGGFIEIFDEEGNGCEHAHVTYAHRGKALNMTGSLVFNGMNISMAHKFAFEATEDGKTRIRLRVAGLGELPPDTAETVSAVWQHFLEGRFKPYVESGRYKAKSDR